MEPSLEGELLLSNYRNKEFLKKLRQFLLHCHYVSKSLLQIPNTTEVRFFLGPKNKARETLRVRN
jgi:hypothetical protein